MSSPIKPPGKPPGAPPAGAAGGRPAGEPAEAFKATLDESEGTSAAEAAHSAGAGAADQITAIAAEIAAGRLDAATAVDQLVARSLEGPTAAMLSEAQRADLEAHLRARLLEDPNLIALTQDLERGS